MALHRAGQAKPMQNGFVETFNGRMRDEFFNEHLFNNLRHARNLVAEWRADFNYHRPALKPRGSDTTAMC